MYEMIIYLTEAQYKWVYNTLKSAINDQEDCQDDAVDRESLDSCKYLLEQLVEGHKKGRG